MLVLCFDYLTYVARSHISEAASTRVVLLEIILFLNDSITKAHSYLAKRPVPEILLKCSFTMFDLEMILRHPCTISLSDYEALFGPIERQDIVNTCNVIMTLLNDYFDDLYAKHNSRRYALSSRKRRLQFGGKKVRRTVLKLV